MTVFTYAKNFPQSPIFPQSSHTWANVHYLKQERDLSCGMETMPARRTMRGSWRRPVPSRLHVAAQSRPAPHLNTAFLAAPSDAGRGAPLPCWELRPSPSTVAVPGVGTEWQNNSWHPTVRQQFLQHLSGLTTFSPLAFRALLFCVCAHYPL